MNRSLSAAALVGAATLAACTPKDAAKTDTAKVGQTGTVSSAMYDPATRTATVHAKDFSFAGADSIPAGWTTFRFVNDGPTLHHLQMARLDSGKTVADFTAATQKPGPFPAWVTLVGGPNAPNSGTGSNGAVNLQPGNYMMLCFVDIPDHVPHFAKGMIRPFTVTPSAAAGTEPAADVTVALSDYTFTVTGALAAGHRTIKVTNGAAQPHELELVKFAAGKSTKDLAAWGAKFEGPPPGDFIGGMAVISKGQTGTFDVDLTPGSYLLICFVPDAKDGKPHMEHGMVKEFTVN